MVILLVIVVFVLVAFFKTIRIVPQKEAYIVQRLGKYARTLEAGFHILIPFVDQIAYRHTLKEQAVDVPPQQCITRDNIAVEVDGILYMQVFDPKRASYGINDYRFASTQLAQTTMRSVMGKLDLDKTFEERDVINCAIVAAVDKASDPWGVKVTRYEVKNILPPPSIKDAMEKQMRAEREKRAVIAESEGDRQGKINRAEGEKQQMIAQSEGEKQK
ncbi:MAG: paraslipin, partial [Planctomycetes bacterium]|nr:paraslipin [Planctomycetota bacterium]